MTSCAYELPSATDIGMGVAMHLQSGNDNTINDFISVIIGMLDFSVIGDHACPT